MSKQLPKRPLRTEWAAEQRQGIFQQILEKHLQNRKVIDVVELKRSRYKIRGNYALRSIIQGRYMSAKIIYEDLIKLITMYDDFDEYEINDLEFVTLKVMYYWCCVKEEFEIEKCIYYFESILDKYESKLPIILCQLIKCYSFNKSFNWKAINTYLYRAKYVFENILLHRTDITYPGVAGFSIVENQVDFIIVFLTGYESAFEGTHKMRLLDCQNIELKAKIDVFRFTLSNAQCCPGIIVHTLIIYNQVRLFVTLIWDYIKMYISNWSKSVFSNDPIISKYEELIPLLNVCRNYLRFYLKIDNKQASTEFITHAEYCMLYKDAGPRYFVCKYSDNKEITVPILLGAHVDLFRCDKPTPLPQPNQFAVNHTLTRREKVFLKKNNKLKRKPSDTSKTNVILPHEILKALVSGTTELPQNYIHSKMYWHSNGLPISVNSNNNGCEQVLNKSQTNGVKTLTVRKDLYEIPNNVVDVLKKNMQTQTDADKNNTVNKLQVTVIETLRTEAKNSHMALEQLKKSNLDHKKKILELESKLNLNRDFLEIKKKELNEEVTKFEKLNQKHVRLKSEHNSVLQNAASLNESCEKLKARNVVLEQLNKESLAEVLNNCDNISKIYSYFILKCKNSNSKKASDKYEEIEKYFAELEINNNECIIQNGVYESDKKVEISKYMCQTNELTVAALSIIGDQTESSSTTQINNGNSVNCHSELDIEATQKGERLMDAPSVKKCYKIATEVLRSKCSEDETNYALPIDSENINNITQNVSSHSRINIDISCNSAPQVPNLMSMVDLNSTDKSRIDSHLVTSEQFEQENDSKNDEFEVVRRKKCLKIPSEPRRMQLVNANVPKYPIRTAPKNSSSHSVVSAKNSIVKNTNVSHQQGSIVSRQKKATLQQTTNQANKKCKENTKIKNGGKTSSDSSSVQPFQAAQKNKIDIRANIVNEASVDTSSQDYATVETNALVTERQVATQQFMSLVSRIHNDLPTHKQYNIFQALKLVRERNNNSLSFLAHSEIVRRVKEILQVPRPSSWAVIPNNKLQWQQDVAIDVCTICLEEMSSLGVTTVECDHRFHTKCLRPWVKVNSVCPICRKPAFMDEDYPPLMQPGE